VTNILEANFIWSNFRPQMTFLSGVNLKGKTNVRNGCFQPESAWKRRAASLARGTALRFVGAARDLNKAHGCKRTSGERDARGQWRKLRNWLNSILPT